MIFAQLAHLMMTGQILLWRFKEERAERQDYIDATKRTLSTTGRGITFNALSVIVGFSVLLASNFRQFDFLDF